MKCLPIVTILLVPDAMLLAGDGKCDFTALEKPISVLSKPVSAIQGDPRVCDTVPPPTHSVWQSIQGPLDRSMGRTVDQQSYEVGLIGLARFGQARGFDRLWLERERQLRLDDQRLRLDQLDERSRRVELDRREYMISLYSGPSPMERQVEADRNALDAAKAERDRGLIEASNSLDRALKQPGANRKELEAKYETTRSRIREQYEQTRGRILGDPPPQR